MQAAARTAHTELAPQYRSTLACFRHVLREEGVAGLYKGKSLRANMACLSVGSAAYFSTYHVLSRAMEAHVTPDSLTLGHHIVAGGTTGMLYWAGIYALDVVKTRMVQDTLAPVPRYRGLWHCLRETVRESGVRGLYRGLGVAVVRGIPVNAVMLTVNNHLKR